MIKKDYEYISGSTVQKPDYNVYEENKVLNARKQYKNNRNAKIRVIVYMLVMLSAGLIVMCRFAMITHLSYNIHKTESQYSDLRNENSQIRAQVEKETDLETIKEIAENRLAMQKPDKSQIVYIKVPRDDYTIVMNTADEVKQLDGNSLPGIIDRITGFINLLN